ncbi:NADH:flavin oxidoreductase/NADH oxidase [Kineosporia sp. NBRC 101731]|uniref:NADH:flavin oxidoreductase/NADH oxidase n=1 Tax=Kineosporia sp. NBRC 101731 TaxID=3032199 RepID=UPI002554C1C8|nr:NADH:flavin oxidoreductase/NADH oxidase [Kineosporia sp. NBRC 101731]
MSLLFSPLTLRGVTVPNRAWVSPMCQYSSEKGHPTDWHLVHLGSLARGGAGLVMQEATAVVPEGRISPQDAGIWNDSQAVDYERITRFVKEQGSVPAIQLAHAGRKASTYAPWRGRGSVPAGEGGWKTVAPSENAYNGFDVPAELALDDIPALVQAWADAARRAVSAGFEVLEVHAAHGYLLHQFLSPLSNLRTDSYGGDLAGRSRLLIEIVDAVRATIPDRTPLLVRVSATDWVPDGLDVDEVAQVATTLKDHGVDLVDVSSGGNHPDQKITVGPGYQVPFAAKVKQVSGLPTAAVGLITEPKQAEQVLTEGSADAVLLARVLLREPSWPQRAAAELGDDLPWPPQYVRGR